MKYILESNSQPKTLFTFQKWGIPIFKKQEIIYSTVYNSKRYYYSIDSDSSERLTC